MKAFNGKRLKEARYFNSMSITELANKLGITKQMVSKYENNLVKNDPKPEFIFKLPEILKFPPKFYFNEDKFKATSGETFFRSRFTTTQKQKSPARSIKNLAYVYRDFLEEYLDFPVFEIAEDVIENLETLYLRKNFEQIAQNLRNYWRLGTQPIPNMVNLLERKGFIVCDIPETLEKVDAFGGKETINGNDYYIIFVETTATDFFRRQFSLAHELGHWAFHSQVLNPQDLEPPEYRLIEQEANEFAVALLLPQEDFEKDLRGHQISLNYLLTLCEKWRVSVSAMLMRMKSLKFLDDMEYLRLQKQMSSRGWRKKEPLSDVFEIKHPQSLKDGTEILVNENIFSKRAIPNLIEERYGRMYPTDLIENIANLPVGYITSENDLQIVSLKGETNITS